MHSIAVATDSTATLFLLLLKQKSIYVRNFTSIVLLHFLMIVIREFILDVKIPQRNVGSVLVNSQVSYTNIFSDISSFT
jgi:hypothetical protein